MFSALGAESFLQRRDARWYRLPRRCVLCCMTNSLILDVIRRDRRNLLWQLVQPSVSNTRSCPTSSRTDAERDLPSACMPAILGFVRHGYSVPRPRFSNVKRALGQISYGSVTPLGGEP